MDHGIEAICSSRPNVLVNAVCQQGLRYLHDGLLRTKQNPDDEEARLSCQLGSGCRRSDCRRGCQWARAMPSAMCSADLRRAALFLHSGNDAKRAAVQPAGHRNCSEIGVRGARRTRRTPVRRSLPSSLNSAYPEGLLRSALPRIASN